MSLKFSKKDNSWYVRFDNKYIYYSVNKYGIYAKELAKKSDITHKKYKNMILVKNNKCKMIIYSKKYGYFNIKIDKDDIEIIQKYKWHISNNRGLFYCQTNSEKKKYISLHRYIMNNHNNLNKNDIIDHKNRDTLDCRKNNLNIVNKKYNNQNRSINTNNTSGIKGVRKRNNSWICKWRDENGKEHTKSFSKNKYNNAKQLAIEERKKHTKHYYFKHIVIINKK